MISPIAFSIGPLQVHWYGIAYAASLGLSIWILTLLNKRKKVFKDNNQIFDFLFWIFLLGVLLGGRLGYILFYNLSFYLENPSQIIALWQGGMSFHGGLIGAAIVSYFLAKKHHVNLADFLDMIAVPGGLATAMGRIANFINRELYGRVIENSKFEWLGVDFGDGLLRYPSQLFQSFNAVLMFIIMLFIWSKKPRRGVLAGSYLIMHGLFRFFTEFLREPDEQIGFLFNFFTLGQLLSLGMSVAGVAWLLISKKKNSVHSFS